MKGVWLWAELTHTMKRLCKLKTLSSCTAGAKIVPIFYSRLKERWHDQTWWKWNTNATRNREKVRQSSSETHWKWRLIWRARWDRWRNSRESRLELPARKGKGYIQEHTHKQEMHTQTWHAYTYFLSLYKHTHTHTISIYMYMFVCMLLHLHVHVYDKNVMFV